jgi:protein-tyrosine kinase
MKAPPHAVSRLAARADDVTHPSEQRVPIGELIRGVRELSDDQIAQILMYQQKNGVRFGEAAVALRFANRDDVIDALAQQFNYPYKHGSASNPPNSELIVAAHPFSDEADAFGELRSRLLMEVLTDQARCALAVLSPDIGDGKSYVAANLAISFSQLGGRTLLIDADLRTPRLHKMFGVPHTAAGLSSLLSGRAESRTVHVVPDLPALHLLPAGPLPPNPLELLQRPGFGGVIEEMLDNFDHVVVDTPACAHGADARLIAAMARTALVIGRKGHSRISALQGLLGSLDRAGTRVAGVIMNEY